MSNKNKNQNNQNNQGQDAPVMETETTEMNLQETQEPKESIEEMEARVRKEMEEKHKADMMAQEERLAKLESNANASVNVPAQKSFSPSDVNSLLDSMLAEKDALVEKLKGEKEDMVIDDTVSRAMNSTMISKNLKGKFNPKRGTANFMMRQNTKYAIEGKPEPYTREALENTLKREMGVA